MAKNLLNYDGLTYFLSKLKTWILAQGYTTNTGTITKVKTTAGAHTAIDVSSGAAEFNVPTNTSHLSNDSNFVADANYVHTDNNYTTTEKNKLAGIASGAEVNVVKAVEDNSNSSNQSQYQARKEDNGITLTLSANGTLGIDTLNGIIGPSSWGYASLDYFVTGNTVYNAIEPLAPKASPALTGTPTAPTASLGTNTTQIATTAFVNASIANAQTGRAAFQGAVDSNSEISGLSSYSKGYHWIVQTAGTYVGQTCEVGDMIYCIADKNSSYSASDFTVIQNNLDISIITDAEIDALFAS